MKRPRILIVDDSSVMRKIVERSLLQAESTKLANGEELIMSASIY